MQQPPKRQKIADELDLDEFAASIESLANTIKSIGQTHGYFLKVNKAVVNYLKEVKNKSEAVNLETSKASDEIDEEP